MALINEKSRTTYFSQCARCLQVGQEKIFLKFLEGISPFCGATDTPVFGLVVTSPVGFKSGVGSMLHVP